MEKTDLVKQIEEKLKKRGPTYIENREKELVRVLSYGNILNIQELQVIGHQLKGSAKTYGFDALGDLGEQLENSAAQADLDKSRRLAEEILLFFKNARNPNP